MSSFNFQKKNEHEAEAAKAVQKRDYSKAFYHTNEAARYAFALAEQCDGVLRQAYIQNGNDLLDLAEKEIKPRIGKANVKTPEKVSGNGEEAPAESKVQAMERPSVRLDDVAGMEDVKEQIRLRMIEPLKRPEEAKKHGIRVGGGILLYGPPGTGKTFIAKAVAGELNLPFYAITSADVFGKYVGESENNIRAIFADARKNPLSVVFIDELETIFRRRDDNVHETTQKVISVLLQELDGVNSENSNPILLMGATNNPWMVDEAFLRTNRFDVKAYVGLPDREARKKIITNSVKSIDYPVDQDAIEYLADATDGFNGADVTGILMNATQMAFDKNLDRYTKALFTEARAKAIPSCSAETSQKIAEWEESIGITRDKKKIIKPAAPAPAPAPEQPKAQDPAVASPAPASAPKPPAAPAPKPPAAPAPKPAPAVKKNGVTLDDIKGLKEAKEAVYDSLINPILYPEVYNTLGVIPGTGLLLYGPPGTGKTMFGRAIANELRTEFIPVTLSEVRGKTPLQTVQMISQLFSRARTCPHGCVLFLDDCEEILSRPGSSKAYGVSQFLTELDGLKKNGGSKVFVLIATNRPWMIDGALLRSGRISASVYVGLPDKETRKEIILSAIAENSIADDVDIDKLADLTEGYSCAEIFHKEKGGGVCNLARTFASRRWVDRIKQDPREKDIVEPLCWKDFESALASVTPSSVRDSSRIEEIRKFKEMYSIRIVSPVNDEGETQEVTIASPDAVAVKDMVFSSATIQNTPDYKHFSDKVFFMYNDEYDDSNNFNAYATVISNVLERYGIHDPVLEEDPLRPAIVLYEGLNLVNFTFAAFYKKYNPALTLDHPEKVREFLVSVNEILCRNGGGFDESSMKELDAKYELFSQPSEYENIKALACAMTAITIAHELGHIVYGDIFKIGTGSAYARNMERSADEFAVDVVNGIQDPALREVLTLGAALSFVADCALGGADRDIPVDSDISHPATLERFRILLEKTGDGPARYKLTEENFLQCIP